jgi:hypothetical protein
MQQGILAVIRPLLREVKYSRRAGLSLLLLNFFPVTNHIKWGSVLDDGKDTLP